MSFSPMESIFNDRTARYWDDFHSDKFGRVHHKVSFICTFYFHDDFEFSTRDIKVEILWPNTMDLIVFIFYPPVRRDRPVPTVRSVCGKLFSIISDF